MSVSRRLKRGWKAVSRRVREWRMIAKGLASTDHPILAHVIPMRRCNLAWTQTCLEIFITSQLRCAAAYLSGDWARNGVERNHFRPDGDSEKIIPRSRAGPDP